MLEQDIILAVQTAIPNAKVEARMEGNHAHLSVVSETFKGLSPVKRQQMVYAALSDAIASGAIHAVHMKTLDA
jgi:acid stress-induced BolA-like protein IbaG/YrbA